MFSRVAIYQWKSPYGKPYFHPYFKRVPTLMKKLTCSLDEFDDAKRKREREIKFIEMNLKNRFLERGNETMVARRWWRKGSDRIGKNGRSNFTNIFREFRSDSRLRVSEASR